jgi:hypothetical protein
LPSNQLKRFDLRKNLNGEKRAVGRKVRLSILSSGARFMSERFRHTGLPQKPNKSRESVNRRLAQNSENAEKIIIDRFMPA